MDWCSKHAILGWKNFLKKKEDFVTSFKHDYMNNLQEVSRDFCIGWDTGL